MQRPRSPLARKAHRTLDNIALIVLVSVFVLPPAIFALAIIYVVFVRGIVDSY